MCVCQHLTPKFNLVCVWKVTAEGTGNIALTGASGGAGWVKG